MPPALRGDVYFDNAAGPISDSVMRRINVGAPVVICRHSLHRELGATAAGTVHFPRLAFAAAASIRLHCLD